MPLAQNIELPDLDPCDIVRRWKIDLKLARILLKRVIPLLLMHPKVRLAAMTLGLGSVAIISGWRSLQRQEELRQAGRPTADPHRSTHLGCPATGVDLSWAGATPEQWLILGQIAEQEGLRWGGGAPRGADGLPVRGEYAHFDLGPRV